MADNLHDTNDLERLIVRYLNNQMEKNERYQFEQALERDPFLAEAVEGLAAFKPSEAMKDLGSISFHKGAKKSGVKPVYLAVILMIILLLVLAVVWFQHKRSTKDVVEDTVTHDESVVFADTLAFIDRTDSLENFEDSLLSDSVVVNSKEQEKITKPDPIIKEVKSAKKEEVVPTQQSKTVTTLIKKESKQEEQTEVTDNREVLGPSLILVPSIEANKILTADSSNFSGLHLRIGGDETNSGSGDNQPESNAVENPGETVSESSAAPQGGMDELIQYVEKNVIYPVDDGQTARVLLRIGFTVSENGRLYNFKQERGPDNELFFDEAVRVLREGPSWSPALKDGKAVEEQVSLNVVFRP